MQARAEDGGSFILTYLLPEKCYQLFFHQLHLTHGQTSLLPPAAPHSRSDLYSTTTLLLLLYC
uniref:Uncharacterized protein n=1 Tax=Astyanax mexicanus TaxID=7994 RepID=A0A8B9HA91_ASTMX